MIPRIIHQVWGGGAIPDEVTRWMFSWRAMHADWQYILWRDAPQWLVNRGAFDQAPSWAQKSDVLRYEVLKRYGGLYVDADCQCHRPIDPLAEGDYLLVDDGVGRCSAALVGCKEQSELMARCVSWLPMRTGEPADRKTGPGLITDAADSLGLTWLSPQEAQPYYTHHAMGSWYKGRRYDALGVTDTRDRTHP